jgi:hypothetical protein
MKNILVVLTIICASFCNAQNTFWVNKFISSDNSEAISEIILEDHHILICYETKEPQDLQVLNIALSGNLNIYLYDVLGNLIFHDKCYFRQGQCEQLEISQGKQGIFFLYITNGPDSVTRKILLH